MDGLRPINSQAVLRLLLGFVVLSTVAGLLMAGLAIPAIGATGSGRPRAGSTSSTTLPSEFYPCRRWPSSPASSMPTGS